MAELLVFDPAQCCSTGVCGPEVDTDLVRFAADLEWLRGRGVDVRRYNLAQEPNAFAASPTVRRSLQQKGTECLPLLISGDAILSQGRYPARDELAAWTGASAPKASSESAPEMGTACCAPALVGLGSIEAAGLSSGCC